ELVLDAVAVAGEVEALMRRIRALDQAHRAVLAAVEPLGLGAGLAPVAAGPPLHAAPVLLDEALALEDDARRGQERAERPDIAPGDARRGRIQGGAGDVQLEAAGAGGLAPRHVEARRHRLGARSLERGLRILAGRRKPDQ